MRFLSLFSGIEAASVAWKPLVWECVGVSEIEKFPCAVLATHYPEVPNLGDVTKITEQQIKDLGKIDVLVGGFPCQDVSIAGKRKGFQNADGSVTRSGLFYDAMRVVNYAREHCGLRYAVLENVPGLFSSNSGEDFKSVVEELVGARIPAEVKIQKAGCAAGSKGFVEWCVLDAQFRGLAQRRKRVFLVADFGDWANRPPILLERQGVSGYSPPSREAREVAASSTEECFTPSVSDVAHCLNAGGMGRIDFESETLIAFGHQNSSSQGISANEHITPTLDKSKTPAIAFAQNQLGEIRVDDVFSTLNTNSNASGRNTPLVNNGLSVRRLTPKECCRLQGFPDDYLDIMHRNKPAADGPKYKALGNSFAAPVVRYIGEQIELAEQWS